MYQTTWWMVCCQCGGDIPPETQWGAAGESADGECVHKRSDGMCGAFGPREEYEEEGDDDDDKR